MTYLTSVNFPSFFQAIPRTKFTLLITPGVIRPFLTGIRFPPCIGRILRHKFFIPRGIGRVSSLKLTRKVKIAHCGSWRRGLPRFFATHFSQHSVTRPCIPRMDRCRAVKASSGIRMHMAMHPCMLRRPVDRNVADNQRILLAQAIGGMSALPAKQGIIPIGNAERQPGPSFPVRSSGVAG